MNWTPEVIFCALSVCANLFLIWLNGSLTENHIKEFIKVLKKVTEDELDT